MTVVINRALKQFTAELGDELALAQVLIRRQEQGFELRHVADGNRAPEALCVLGPSDARGLAQYTDGGAFRPLKSAPDLRDGWRMPISGEAELETALNSIYPGAIADWRAARTPKPPVTGFREFVGRQSGMYRIAAMLDDAQAAAVIQECCDKKLCLKRRLWTVAGLATDGADEKSLIPCLEPCAVLLEFARKAMRLKLAEETRIA